MQSAPTANPYAKIVANSKRVRWDIAHDVIRHRRFDFEKTFLPPAFCWLTSCNS
jgi:hypothetical protein